MCMKMGFPLYLNECGDVNRNGNPSGVGMVIPYRVQIIPVYINKTQCVNSAPYALCAFHFKTSFIETYS